MVLDDDLVGVNALRLPLHVALLKEAKIKYFSVFFKCFCGKPHQVVVGHRDAELDPPLHVDDAAVGVVLGVDLPVEDLGNTFEALFIN